MNFLNRKILIISLSKEDSEIDFPMIEILVVVADYDSQEYKPTTSLVFRFPAKSSFDVMLLKLWLKMQFSLLYVEKRGGKNHCT
jgi:hypothetical protein